MLASISWFADPTAEAVRRGFPLGLVAAPIAARWPTVPAMRSKPTFAVSHEVGTPLPPRAGRC
jgi:hypothetical protein